MNFNKLSTKPFQEAQKELGECLNEFLGKKQDGKLESRAQNCVDEYFKKQRAIKRHIVLDCGIEIVGAKLAFDIGRIGIGLWFPKWFPEDRYGIEATVPGSVALGYSNGYQIYIEPRKTEPALLVARYGMGVNRMNWCPAIQGMPQSNTIPFVGLERAKQLGHLYLLQTKQ